MTEITYICGARITDYMETHTRVCRQELVRYLLKRLDLTSTELQRLRDLTPNDDPYFLALGARTHSVGKYQSCMLYWYWLAALRCLSTE